MKIATILHGTAHLESDPRNYNDLNVYNTYVDALHHISFNENDIYYYIYHCIR